MLYTALREIGLAIGKWSLKYRVLYFSHMAPTCSSMYHLIFNLAVSVPLEFSDVQNI